MADHHAWDREFSGCRRNGAVRLTCCDIAFVMWLVDVNKPQARTEHPATPNAPFPPPSDAISLPSSKVIPIICFNHTVRLQCPSTGLITPVMVIRKVEGPQTVQAFEGSRKENEVTRCAVNELPSDPVCQLHKVSLFRKVHESLLIAPFRLRSNCMLLRWRLTRRCTDQIYDRPAAGFHATKKASHSNPESQLETGQAHHRHHHLEAVFSYRVVCRHRPATI